MHRLAKSDSDFFASGRFTLLSRGKELLNEVRAQRVFTP